MTTKTAAWPAILASLLLVAPVSGIADDVEDPGLALLRNFLDNVETLTAGFEQQLIDADDVVVEESAGTVEIARPGRFRWSYAYPYEQLLVADGVNVWSYDVDLEQVTVKAQSDALGATPALLLGGSRDVLEEFDYVDSFTDRGTVWVRMRPKSSENGFTRVELGFTDGSLSRMLFADNLDQTTIIGLFDITTNAPLDEARFRFEPPAGVDVVGEARVAGHTPN